MIDPKRLVDELVRAGWTVVDRGFDSVWLRCPGTRPSVDLRVPLDPDADDFEALWNAVLSELESAVDVGVKAAHVLGGLVAPHDGRVQGRLDRLQEKP